MPASLQTATPPNAERTIIITSDTILGSAIKQLFINEGQPATCIQPSSEVYGALKDGGVSRVVIDTESAPGAMALIEKSINDLNIEPDRIVALGTEQNQDMLSQAGALGVSAVLKPINPLTFVRQLDSAFVLDTLNMTTSTRNCLLFIDDNTLDLFLVAPALHESGYFEVCLAVGALDGLHRFNELAPDIVIMPLRMQKMSGPALLKKLLDTSDGRNLNVIFTAHESDAQELRNFANLGIKGALRKPFSPTTIVSQIEDILGLDEPQRLFSYPPEHLTEEVQRIVGMTAPRI